MSEYLDAYYGVNGPAPRTDAEWLARVDAIEVAPAAEESFDTTAALRRVMALADEIGARPPASQFVHVNAIRQAIRGTL